MVDKRQIEKVLSVVAVMLLVAAIYLLWWNGANCVSPAHANPPLQLEPAAAAEETRPKIDAVIMWQTRNVPKHPVRRKAEWRAELVDHIATEAEKKGLPWALTTAVVYRESSFRPNAKGDYDEDGNPQSIGLMQVGRGVQAKCKRAGLDLTVPEDQVKCGTWWLRHCWQEVCKGNLQYGMAYYASGRVCRPDSRHLKSVVKDRFNLARKYQRVANGEVS